MADVEQPKWPAGTGLPSRVLVPIDGSDASFRALRLAARLCDLSGSKIHIVHFTPEETEATEIIVERARSTLAEEGVESAPEVSIDVDMDLRPEAHVGKRILEFVSERGYDHVIMGHHGAGAVQRAILGSAAETVVRGEQVPVTVVP